jgi:hypothetical protein
MLQIMQQLVLGTRLDLRPTVTFGDPLRLQDLIEPNTSASADAVMSAILQQARQVLARYQGGQTHPSEIPVPA